MAECYIYTRQSCDNAYQSYIKIDDAGQGIVKENRIIYGDMQFESIGEWCFITTTPGEIYSEEILLLMSSGNTLIYFYSDEDQMDCEFIVIENNVVVRKFLHYFDTPELNQDIGRLPCEEKINLDEWNDLDILIELAKTSPELLFKR